MKTKNDAWGFHGEIVEQVHAGKTICALIDRAGLSERNSGLPTLLRNVFDRIEEACEALDEFILDLPEGDPHAQE